MGFACEVDRCSRGIGLGVHPISQLPPLLYLLYLLSSSALFACLLYSRPASLPFAIKLQALTKSYSNPFFWTAIYHLDAAAYI
jgi:hypothetical protein